MARVVRAAGGVSQATLDATSATLVTLSPATTVRNVIQPSADVIPLAIRGKVGQTAALQRWEDSAGSPLVSVSAGGALSAASLAASTGLLTRVYNFFSTGPRLDLGSQTEAQVGYSDREGVTLAVIAFSGQTSNVQEWRTSTSAVLASVTIDGRHRFVAANEQATIGAAGAASPLPLTPTKYLKVVDSTGATLVIPAYAA